MQIQYISINFFIIYSALRRQKDAVYGFGKSRRKQVTSPFVRRSVSRLIKILESL